MVAFTDPYYESDLVVVVRADGPYAAAKSLSDLSGARITGQLNTFHYGVIAQIPGVKQEVAMSDFPVMTAALSGGRIDGYVSERPGALSALSAVAANPQLAFVSFEAGQGFTAEPADTTIAVALRLDSPLLAPINAALAELTEEARVQLMTDALQRQPVAGQ